MHECPIIEPLLAPKSCPYFFISPLTSSTLSSLNIIHVIHANAWYNRIAEQNYWKSMHAISKRTLDMILSFIISSTNLSLDINKLNSI